MQVIGIFLASMLMMSLAPSTTTMMRQLNFFGSDQSGGAGEVVTIDASNGLTSEDYLGALAITENMISNAEINGSAPSDVAQQTSTSTLSSDATPVEKVVDSVVNASEAVTADVAQSDVSATEVSLASQDGAQDVANEVPGDSMNAAIAPASSSSASSDDNSAQQSTTADITTAPAQSTPHVDNSASPTSSDAPAPAEFLIPLAYAQTAKTTVRVLPDVGPILPDNPLYGLKRGFEGIDTALTFNPAAKVVKQVKYAEIRLAEVNAMVKKNDGTHIPKLLSDYQTSIVSAGKTADGLTGQDKTSAQALVAIAASKQKIVLDEVTKKVGNPVIKNSLNVASSKAAVVKENALSALKTVKPNTAIKVSSMAARAGGKK